jgi:hypothetical protein
MKVIITVETDAFIGSPAYEVARILRELACQFEVLGLHRLVVRDFSGTRAGLVELEGEEEGPSLAEVLENQ